ncbi:MAG TPA: neutral/alkaline non-lysosomal ceramidase N-terminal domain-containing protein [archaeon]|nr:neutral/alkaline non-lysosomal ceramidase N-terminal domain-containing protein [archaeon]
MFSGKRLWITAWSMIMLVLHFGLARSSPAGQLLAGAARVNITPAKSIKMAGYGSRKEGFKGVHDSLFARAIVVDDGQTRGAIVAVDVVMIPPKMLQNVAPRLEREAGIKPDLLLLMAIHTHGGPALPYPDDHPRQSRPDTEYKAPEPAQLAYVSTLEDKIVAMTKQAAAALQPAQVGYGEGRANVNMNRRAERAEGGYWLGLNPDGPSDKTVAVVKFTTLQGEPIAILFNYGVHGTVLGSKNYLITGDLPGVASQFVEKKYGDRFPVLFTSGAAGDQSPLYDVEVFDNFIGSLGSLAHILGREVYRVAENEIIPDHGARVYGAQKTVSCPGKKLVGGFSHAPEGPRYEDTDPVEIRLSVLAVNHIIFAGVSGEVFCRIALRLKEESPYRYTMMLTHCNGRCGYIPDDDAYDKPSYEIQASRFKKGCAENAIVNGILELITW